MKTKMFYDTFIGEYVTLILDSERSVSLETAEGIQAETLPLTTEGYVIDMDKAYIYLGPEKSTTQAIPFGSFKHIEIVEPKSNHIEEIISKLKKDVH